MNRSLFNFTALLIALATQVAEAHFVWLVPENSEEQVVVQVYFGEDAAPDDPELLKYVDGIHAWKANKTSGITKLDLSRTPESLSVALEAQESAGTIFLATHDLGVMSRGGSTFRLVYHAQTGPSLNDPSWGQVDVSSQLRLHILPQLTEQGVRLHVHFDGKTLDGSEVVASGPGMEDFTGKTGESGTIDLPVEKAGLYSIRAKHVEAGAGEVNGKTFDETRHYSTLALRVQSDLSQADAADLQPLEQPVTSFGGAVVDDHLYIYGGHTGGAHSYSLKEQERFVRRLNLHTGKWDVLGEGPPLQGLALVAHEHTLYRIGGFTAQNAEDEAHDLRSQNSVAAFDLKTNTWKEMPALPEVRSSFDAAVLDGTIYVIGGWGMAGEAESVWHKTAWSLDLNAESPEWSALPEPPFQRRALAVAAFQGKLYAIGGMQQSGGPTTRVDIYDPQAKTWSRGADLQTPAEDAAEEGQAEATAGAQSRRSSGGMTGFGASAFATGGKLYVSTINGDLQRLTADGSAWEILRKTPTPRFFHRMLPVSESQLLVVGGASMETGKFDKVEILNVAE